MQRSPLYPEGHTHRSRRWTQVSRLLRQCVDAEAVSGGGRTKGASDSLRSVVTMTLPGISVRVVV